MIDLYSWPTPNGHKIQIMLEECGLILNSDWIVHAVDIGIGDQFKPEFLKISPNNRIPALLDHDGPNGQQLALFESGAILIYLAEKYGKFYGRTEPEKFRILQWLMFQMAGVGPMFGQANHFRNYTREKFDYSINRYTSEVNRLCGVMNKQLAQTPYIAGESYSIADIAIFPWLRNSEKCGVKWAEFPYVRAWYEGIAARPSVVRALMVLADLRRPLTDDKARAVLFGETQITQLAN